MNKAKGCNYKIINNIKDRNIVGKFFKTSIFGLSSLVLVGSLSSCTEKTPKDFVEGKFNISISAPSVESERLMLQTWKEGFEELHPDTNIIIQNWGSATNIEDYARINSMQRDKLSDIAYTTDDTVSSFASKNNLIDLRKYYESSLETDYSNFYESMLNMTSYAGDFRPTTSYEGSFIRQDSSGIELEKDDSPEYGIYFAPREYNMPAIICNKDLFEEFEIEIPVDDENWNFDTFIGLLHEINEKILEKGETNSEYLLYRAIELNQTWEAIYTTIMKHFESDGLFKKENNGDVCSNLKSEKNLEIFETIVESFGENSFVKAIDQESGKQFTNSKIFMATASYPEVRNFIKTCENLDFLPFPTDYVGAGCGGYAVFADRVYNKNSKGQRTELKTQTVDGVTKNTMDICWEFLTYMMSEAGQNACGKEALIQPIRKSLTTTGEWLTSIDENLNHKAFAEKLELSLDTYYFAEPDKRLYLRNGISVLFENLFNPDASKDSITSYINQANGYLRKGGVTVQ